MDSSKRLLIPTARKLRKRTTSQEAALWFQLKNRRLNGFKFRRQYSVGRFVVDFINVESKLIIEIDGGQHNEKENLQKDQIRTKWLESQGYTVLRFWDNEVSSNIDGVLEVIAAQLQALTLALSHK